LGRAVSGCDGEEEGGEIVNRAELERRGFEGWIPLLTADTSLLLPTIPGVYAVAYDLGRPTEWPTVSCGGWYKGKDPSVASDRLDAEWHDDCDIVYIGKTDQTLRKRIRPSPDLGVEKPLRTKAVA
jgi:hypothetical protein